MKILVIDDNKDITEMISVYLDSQDISCKTINQGKEGLDVIKKENFDAIILDLAMPEFTGYDIYNELKEKNMLKSLNVIVFTASSIPDRDIEEMVANGVKGVIKKPLSIEELVQTIKKFTQK